MGVAAKTIYRHEASAKAPRATDRTMQEYLRVLKVDELYLTHGIGKKPEPYKAVGPKAPASVVRYVRDKLGDDDERSKLLAKRLLGLDWAGLGNANPTEPQIRSMHAALETIAGT